MAKEEKRVLTLDKYEHGVVINALNEMPMISSARSGPPMPWTMYF